MNYKKIALLAFLLPVASYSQTIEEQIQELQEVQFQKELELSDIGKMISERDAFLRNGQSYIQDLLGEYKNKKKSEAGNENLSDQEIIAAYDKASDELIYCFDDAYKNNGNIEQLLIDAFITKDKKEFASLRFFCSRCSIERSLIEKLVARYAKCFQEVIELDQKIIQLSNQENIYSCTTGC